MAETESAVKFVGNLIDGDTGILSCIRLNAEQSLGQLGTPDAGYEIVAGTLEGKSVIGWASPHRPPFWPFEVIERRQAQ